MVVVAAANWFDVRTHDDAHRHVAHELKLRTDSETRSVDDDKNRYILAHRFD